MKSLTSSRGRSKDELGQTGHARRIMRLKLTQKIAFCRYLSNEAAYNSKMTGRTGKGAVL